MSALSAPLLRQGFMHLFYPHLCEGCNRPLVAEEEVLCLACGTLLPETAYHTMSDNETTLRFSGRVGFEKATSYAWFVTDGLLQHLLHGLKYKGKREIGTYLGSRFAADLSRSNWADGIDIIIPVPLHRAKQAQRGYNQSMIIAEAMAKELGIIAADNMLRRIRDTETQTNKTRAERTENMTGAFLIDDPKALFGKHILLIDDVLTTGSTLEACAHALHAAADVKISIASIGIAIS